MKKRERESECWIQHAFSWRRWCWRLAQQKRSRDCDWTVNNMVPEIAAHLSNAAMTKSCSKCSETTAERQQQDHTRLCMTVITTAQLQIKLCFCGLSVWGLMIRWSGALLKAAEVCEMMHSMELWWVELSKPRLCVVSCHGILDWENEGDSKRYYIIPYTNSQSGYLKMMVIDELI